MNLRCRSLWLDKFIAPWLKCSPTGASTWAYGPEAAIPSFYFHPKGAHLIKSGIYFLLLLFLGRTWMVTQSKNQHNLNCDQPKHETNAVLYLINSSKTRLPGRHSVICFGCKDGKNNCFVSEVIIIKKDFCINRKETVRLQFILNKLFFLFPCFSTQRLSILIILLKVKKSSHVTGKSFLLA